MENVSEYDSTVRDYLALMKPRVMSLVVFTSIIGMILAPGEIHIVTAIISIICISIGSGASGAMNMWYDRDIDAIMLRTRKRPLVLNKMPASEALAFGVILGFFSVFIMAFAVNYISSILLLFTVLFYIVIYTIYLKRNTPQNIVIGGLAGAIPPLIGWTSVTGTITAQPLILVLIIFLWTPAHFWALALYKSDDYKKANIPMMPVIYGDQFTKIQILIYTLLTVASSILPFVIGMASINYLIGASILGAIFIYYSIKLIYDETNHTAPKLFFYSIIYLFILFLILLLP